MQVHRTLPTSKILDSCALTVGTFDGVHRGHQKLIETLKSHADARGLTSAALTFDDMPLCFFRPNDCPKLLTLRDEKIKAFATTKLDHLFIVPFTPEIAGTGAHEFMARWVETTGLKLFLGGPDFALGRGREGTIAELAKLGQEMGFEALALEGKLEEADFPISSTRSRAVIERGEVERSPRFLGRLYRISGDVMGGDQIGRTIGVPTINLQINERKCLPQNGVYAIKARFDDEKVWRDAALNIGMRPTVGGLKKQIEFHVLDANIETPPQRAEVEFFARLREERKFDGLPALVEQMQCDFEKARQIFRELEAQL